MNLDLSLPVFIDQVDGDVLLSQAEDLTGSSVTFVPVDRATSEANSNSIISWVLEIMSNIEHVAGHTDLASAIDIVIFELENTSPKMKHRSNCNCGSPGGVAPCSYCESGEGYLADLAFSLRNFVKNAHICDMPKPIDKTGSW